MIKIATECGMTVKPCAEGNGLAEYGADCSGCMKISDYEINLSKFDKEWALLTAGDSSKFNTMTISWGGFGTLWHKPVITVYVRKNRFIFE